MHTHKIIHFVDLKKMLSSLEFPVLKCFAIVIFICIYSLLENCSISFNSILLNRKMNLYNVFKKSKKHEHKKIFFYFELTLLLQY